MPSSRAPSPSYATLPSAASHPATLLGYLESRFPRVGHDVWLARFASGAVQDDAGCALEPEMPYRPHLRVRYYREVPAEEPVPFAEEIIHADDDLLVACKPHFLPVTPGGQHVNECLLYRLRRRTGNPDLVPLHRLDRETAGLVLFACRQSTRAALYALFAAGRVEKEYEAIAARPDLADPGHEWRVENRIVPAAEWFRSAVVPGPPNARSRIRLIDTCGSLGRFRLDLLTGKRHQARLHLCAIGAPIVNDRLYPELQPQSERRFDRPLLLLARRVRLPWPSPGRFMEFQSSRQLDWPDIPIPAALLDAT